MLSPIWLGVAVGLGRHVKVHGQYSELMKTSDNKVYSYLTDQKMFSDVKMKFHNPPEEDIAFSVAERVALLGLLPLQGTYHTMRFSEWLRSQLLFPPEENKMLLSLGKSMQFSEEFVEETILDLLKNNHINDFPLVFSTEECAKVFLKDAIKIAFADNSLNITEYNWLQKVALTNRVSDQWLFYQLASFLKNQDWEERNKFEITKHMKESDLVDDIISAEAG